MYAQAFRSFQENSLFFIVAAGILAALDVLWIGRSDRAQLASVLVTSGIFAFYSHRMVLLGPLNAAPAKSAPQRIGRFALVYLAFFGGAFVVTLILTILIAPLLAPYGPWQKAKSRWLRRICWRYCPRSRFLDWRWR